MYCIYTWEVNTIHRVDNVNRINRVVWVGGVDRTRAFSRTPPILSTLSVQCIVSTCGVDTTHRADRVNRVILVDRIDTVRAAACTPSTLSTLPTLSTLSTSKVDTMHTVDCSW
jgi:hypothetical protein